MSILAGILAFIISWVGGLGISYYLILNVINNDAYPPLIQFICALLSFAGILLFTIPIAPGYIALFVSNVVGEFLSEQSSREQQRQQAEENRKRLLQEEVERRVLMEERRKQDAIEAERKQKLAIENEQRARVRQQLIDSLLAAGSIIRNPSGDEIVICANGHIYKQQEFHIESQYSNIRYEEIQSYNRYGEYSGSRTEPVTELMTESRFGCPLCKTSLFSYKNDKLNAYQQCKCGYAYHSKHYDKCPICTNANILIANKSSIRNT